MRRFIRLLRKFRRVRRWMVLLAVAVLAFSLPIAWLLLRNAPKTEAAWFDGNWAYRQRVPITNSSGSTQTDFQVQVTVNTAALITAGKLQSSCQDVRLTNVGGKPLSYWIEPSTCNTTTTKIWAKVDSIPTATSGNTADIYLYYGNPLAANEASAGKTFIRDMASAAAAWPLDDTTTTQSFSRVVNATTSAGRNLVINGTFDSDTVWTKGLNWTIGNGVLNGAGATGTTRQSTSLVIGKAYEVIFTISNYSAGSVNALVGLTGSGTFRSSNGTFTQTIIAAGDTTFYLSVGSAFTGDIDNVSVRQVNIPDNSATPITLLTDGNMETSGTASWTVGNSGTLSKQTGTPHGGTQVLRVARNGVNNPYAAQTILTIGAVYRISGYARSDGSATPRVVDNSGQILWSGTTSTSWQPFDGTIVAASTTIDLMAVTSTGTQYAEFDDVVVSLDTGIRTGEIVQDVGMEAATTADWTAIAGATLSKQTGTPHGGAQVFRVAYNGAAPYASQQILALGKTYRVTGYMRSDGTAIPRVRNSTTDITNGIGTSSTSWQFFDVNFVASSTDFRVGSANASTSQYVEFDDISVTEVSPLVGLPTNGVTLGSTANGHLTNAYTFDGTNDVVNIYSADLNSALNATEGSLVAWAKVSGAGVWTDGTARGIVSLYDNSTNRIQITKNNANNALYAEYRAGGTVKSFSPTYSSTNWSMFVLTWSRSNDQVAFYINGSQSGSTLTGLGTWAANLNSTTTAIGALTSTGTNPWSGMINDVKLYNRPLSPAEIQDMYSGGTVDVQTYTTSNYLGRELLRKYNTSVAVAAAATEETTPGPAAYWKFDEGTGQTITDSTTNRDHGTLGANSSSASDDPTWQPENQCISGKCLQLDGSNDLVTVTDPSNGSLDPGTNDFTISVWAKLNAYSGNRNIIRKGTYASSGYTLWADSSGGIVFNTHDGTSANLQTGSGVITLNQWQHIEVSVDRDGTSKIYVDGVDKTSSGSVRTGSLSTSSNFQIGGTNTGMSAYQGFIDEIKYYPYARSTAQVKADFLQGASNAGRGANIGGPGQEYLSEGLIGYWKMDQTSWNGTAGEAVDSSGNSNNGTRVGDATTTAGKFGYGGTFDGTGDYVTVADASSLDATTALTISAWVKGTAFSGNPTIVGKYGTTRSYGTSTNSSGALQMRLSSDGSAFTTLTTSTTLATGSWYHVVGVWDGNTMKAYINGVQDANTTSFTGTLNNSSDALEIGADSNSITEPWNGQLDDVHIYTRALSADEVRNLYNFAPGPVGYWNFDEKTGTTATDLSGNGVTATLTNGPTWATGKYGSAINFDGSNDYLVATNPSIDAFGVGGMTVEAWVNLPTVSTQAQIVDNKGAGSNSAGFNLQIDNIGRPYFRIANGSTQASVTSAIEIDDGNWHYVVGTLERGSSDTMRIYVDGKLSNSGTPTAGWDISSSTNLFFGAYGVGAGSANIPGKIDEVKLYNYARTPGQIIEDMNGGHPLGGSPVGSQVAYWKLDEMQGTTANDTSPNQNNLTLSTATSSWTSSGKTNGAWDGNGANWLSRADDDDLDFAAADDFSISMWFKSDSATNPSQVECILCKTNFTNVPGYVIYANTNGTISFGIDDDTSFQPEDIASTASDVYDGTWHHVVARKTGTSRIDIYIDGKLVGSDTSLSATGTLANSNTLFIGDRDGGNNGDEFNGNLDEIKIYRAALTQEQINIDYNQGATTNYGTGANTEGTTLSDGAGNAPVAEWKFDEHAGTSLLDTSGNAVTGTLTAGPTWAAGKYGGALSFDGTDDYVALATGAINGRITGASAVTVSAWFKNSSTPGAGVRARMISSYIDAGNTGVSLSLNGSTIEAGGRSVTTDGFQTATTAYSGTNAWHQATAVYDFPNDKIYLYLDGVLTTTQSVTFTNTTFTTGSPSAGDSIGGLISGGVGSNLFPGLLDQIQIYNYARTAAQIAYDYNRGKPVGYWKFDECQGSTLNDSSGTGNNGTWTDGGSGSQTAVGTCNTASTAWGNGVTGKFSSSLNFDGTDDYVSIATPKVYNSAAGYSISAWVNLGSTSNQPTIYSEGRNAATGFVWFFVNAGKLELRDNDGTNADQYDSTTSLSTGQWYHVAVTKGPGTAVPSLYINGKLEPLSVNSTLSSGTIPTLDRAAIGTLRRSSLGNYFTGQIDDVRTFTYILSATQIKQVMNEGAGVRYGPSTGSP